MNTRPILRRAVGIIPARFGSTRLPGKPLADIHGKTMIQRTFEAAKRSQYLTDLVVATDDQRVANVVRNFGATVYLTGDCATGTDRIVEVLKTEKIIADIIVNIQGDEPFINPSHIDTAILALDQTLDSSQDGNRVVMSTLATPICNKLDFENQNVVKVVKDNTGKALYFSRSGIPHGVTQFDTTQPTCPIRHIGLYAFERNFLESYSELPVSNLEIIESLEQLRVLQAGYGIQVEVVENVAHGIDTPEQLDEARKRIHVYKQECNVE